MGVVPMMDEKNKVLGAIKAAVSDVFMGRAEAIDLALICLLSDGHLLSLIHI